MVAEYERTKEENLEKLRSFCVSSLQRIQTVNVQAEFSFVDYWGQMKQDESIHPQTPILNILSHAFLSFDIPT